MELLKENCSGCAQINCMINLYCDEEWHELIDKHKSTLQFPKGTRFISEGQNIQGIYVVHSGKVKILKHLSKTTEHILRLAVDGDLVGHRGLCSETYPISAISLTDVTLAFIPNKVFIKILKTNNRLLFNMLQYYTDELRSSEEHMKKIVELPVKNKVAYALLMIAQAFGLTNDNSNTLAFALNRKEISNIAASTYETTIRMLKKLEQENIIELLPKNIRFLNMEKIIEYSKTNYDEH